MQEAPKLSLNPVVLFRSEFTIIITSCNLLVANPGYALNMRCDLVPIDVVIVGHPTST